jgi:hypothetical protein
VKKSRIVWPVAVAALLLTLGLVSGLAAGASGDAGDPSTTTVTSAPGTSTGPTTSTDPGTSTTTTDPGTSTSTTDPSTSTSTTDPGTSTSTTDPSTTSTTTDPTTSTTTTDPVTTTTATDPVTTTATSVPDPPPAAPPTPADPGTTSTTGPKVVAANTPPPTSDSVSQGSSPTNADPQATTTVAAPPTAPCDTTQITCGNNASTQVAIVSQTCFASSQNTTLNVQIQTLGGAPVNNVAISPQTSCLNTLQITQIVEQYCVGCTVIVIPPPPPVIYVPVPGTDTINSVTTNSVTNSVTTVETQAPPPPVRLLAYCMPKPVLRPNGTTGNLIYLPIGEPQRNPTYGPAVPATFVPGIGMQCPETTGTTVSTHVPVFTLTVPASFVGQFVKLCLQPASTTAKPLCHSIRIDLGATISVPVTANVVASVVKGKAKNLKGQKSKSKQQISAAANAFSSVLTSQGKGKGHKPGQFTTKKGTGK